MTSIFFISLGCKRSNSIPSRIFLPLMYISGAPLPNTSIFPFLTDTFGIRSSRCSIDGVFSNMLPATVVIIPSSLSNVLGNWDFTMTSPSKWESSSIVMIMDDASLQFINFVLYPTDETFKKLP